MFKIPENFLKLIASEHNVSKIELETLSLAISGQTAAKIATILDISPVAVRKRLGSVYQKFHLPGNTPGKLEALKSILLEKYQQLSQTNDVQPRRDWGEAVDIPDFYGREQELEKLEQWAIEKRCRLITLLGMGGIGKTALSIKLAQKIADKFDYIVWRSLRSAPPIAEVLADLHKFFSNQQTIDLPRDVDDSTNILIDKYLRRYRCLIILDNLESILQSGTRAGSYKKQYEDYGEFLKRIGEMPHLSCVVLTSREKPREVALLEGNSRPIKVLRLSGLQEAGKNILESEGLSGSEDKLVELIMHYGGNPLALRIVATTIKDLFGGNIERFLEQEIGTFGDIRDLLQEQFERLSDLEIEIMYWLAIEREPVSIGKLKENLVIPPVGFKLLEAIESLRRRSLVEVEKRGASFTLQNVVVEYLYDRLIEKVCQEIETKKINVFNNYALLKATAKEYVREAQARLLLEPVKDRLLALFSDRKQVEEQLKQILMILREESLRRSGYTAGNTINLLCQLKSDLRKYDFSHLTVRQAYLQNINLPEVNFAHSHFSQCVFTKIFGGVLSVAYAPNGEILATGDTNGEILFWQIDDSQLKLRLKADNNWIRSVAYAPNSKYLASAGENQTIKVWSIAEGSCIQILDDYKNQVWSIVFSPNGKTIASGGEDRAVKIWSVATGQCLKTLAGHSNCVRSVAFSPDGQTIASGSEDRAVKIWSVATGQCLKTLAGHSNWVRAVAFAPDGQTIASGSEDQTVKMWSVATGQCLETLTGHRNWVQSVAFSPDGQTIASGSTDRTVKIWNLVTSKYQQTLQGYSIWMRAVAFSPDGKIIASGGEDRAVKMWSVTTGQCLETFEGHSNWVWSVAFSPDGQYLASSSTDRTIKMWSVATGQCREILEKDGNWSRTLRFSPDSKILISGGEDQTIKMWSVTSGQCLKTLVGHDNWVSSVAFSPDGQTIASGSTDRTIKMWSVASGQCFKTLVGHDNWVNSVTFSPDGQTIASSSTDRTIKMWSVATGQCLKTLVGHDNWVSSVAFSPNGQYLASTSIDETIKLWNLKTGQCIKSLRSPRPYEDMNITGVNSLSYSQKAVLKTLGAKSELNND